MEDRGERAPAPPIRRKTRAEVRGIPQPPPDTRRLTRGVIRTGIEQQSWIRDSTAGLRLDQHIDGIPQGRLPYLPARETVGPVSLLDQAAEMIKEKGTFQRELTSQELADIMGSVVKELTAGQHKVRANVPNMQVRINGQQGIVVGSIRIEKPISATISVRCTLGNDTTPDRLRLVGLDVKEEAGVVARMALSHANIKGEALKALNDPNQILFNALGSQLETKGVKLTDIGLNFRDRTLAVVLRGQPIELRSR